MGVVEAMKKVFGEELAIMRVFTVVRRGLWRMRIEENKLTLVCELIYMRRRK